MVRSYVCALAFVFVRLFDKIDSYTGLLSIVSDEKTRIAMVDSIGWILPVLITELFLRWGPNYTNKDLLSGGQLRAKTNTGVQKG